MVRGPPHASETTRSVPAERAQDEGDLLEEGVGMSMDTGRDGIERRGDGLRLVLDTNAIVAAGFNALSSSARILERVRAGAWSLIWNRETRRETEAVLARIPPLAGHSVTTLFRPENEWTSGTHPERFGAVEDPDDRKFAALAAAAGAVLVSNDEHLLARRRDMGVEVLTPSEVMARYGEEGEPRDA